MYYKGHHHPIYNRINVTLETGSWKPRLRITARYATEQKWYAFVCLGYHFLKNANFLEKDGKNNKSHFVLVSILLFLRKIF